MDGFSNALMYCCQLVFFFRDLRRVVLRALKLLPRLFAPVDRLRLLFGEDVARLAIIYWGNVFWWRIKGRTTAGH